MITTRKYLLAVDVFACFLFLFPKDLFS